MKKIIISGVIIAICIAGRPIFKIVKEDIKNDPVANLIMPVATSLLTNLLLWWL